jgi:hypothetical protein
MLALTLGFLGVPGSGRAADVPSRTFNAPIDRVWAVTESVLKSLGWDIDKSEERILWMTERKPVAATEQTVETGLLDALQKAL